ncbi:ArsR/SmtB family transcription factor [Belnapia rosea]|uniref:ArsR/SmtB family transcription factor n=1 Tax=Belnapia rosea TaxID=938405 RepID=UPI00088D444C|nr:metalloregulator ArsR/SmtB family transcription factor [Belnapia rosea]SDB71666.1 DNA-binding transcriptional regulator, ArsR family [Belnapia rosea]
MLLETPTRTLDLQAKLFRGFADPSRLAILNALRPGPLHVGAIVAATGLTQSNVSNHLRCLSECGLVQAEPRGRFVHYRLGDARVGELLGLADALLADTACGVDACQRYGTPAPDAG